MAAERDGAGDLQEARNTMAYENGMSVEYEAVTEKVTVHFRGEKQELPGQYKTREEGIKAGEAYCRSHGWKG